LLADRCEAQTRWHDLRAALAPWMMNQLWASKKARVELEDLVVYNMMQAEESKPERTPEEASADLQNKINSTFQMLAAAAQAKR
jgi:hypothetical protein